MSVFKNKNNLGFLIVVLVLALLGGMLINQAPKFGYQFQEGFSKVNNFSQDQPNNYKVGEPTSTKNWGTPDFSVTPGVNWGKQTMAVVPGQPVSQGVADFLARDPQPIPLPEGELLMFANTPFKPECCPGAYSNSMGCACMTGNQYNYLIERGSNNIPYSEY